MFFGFLFAIAACFLWGGIFIVPQFLPDFSLMEIALGRYFAYGFLSLCLFLIKGPKIFLSRYPLNTWVIAFTFALIANVLYFIGVVIGLRYATPPITVLIIGMCPVLAALYGNWEMKETPFRTLFLPCLGITIGIVLVNITEIQLDTQDFSLKEYLIGLIGASGALLSWSWFAVQNARFLKKNPTLSRSEWTTLIGLGSFFWAIIFGALLSLGENPAINLSKFFNWSESVFRYLICIGILGVICAWLGSYFWNHASSVLPLSIMGPMIIFETIFGLIFVFVFEKRLPTLFETMGIVSMLMGILFIPKQQTAIS